MAGVVMKVKLVDRTTETGEWCHVMKTHLKKVFLLCSWHHGNVFFKPPSVSLSPFSCVCSSSSSRPVETTCFSCSAAWCPLLPAHLLSLSHFNKDFITQLSHRLTSTLKEQLGKMKDEEETEEEREEEMTSESGDVQSHMEGTEVGSPR